MMRRASDLFRDIRVCALRMGVISAGLAHVRQGFEDDAGDPEVLCSVELALTEEMVERGAELARLFAEAESVGLMNALGEAARGIGVEFVA